MTESKSVALPLGDIPKYGVSDETRTRDTQSHNLVLYQLNYAHHMVYLKGFEPLTHGLEGRCSIQLSYRRIPSLGGTPADEYRL